MVSKMDNVETRKLPEIWHFRSRPELRVTKKAMPNHDKAEMLASSAQAGAGAQTGLLPPLKSPEMSALGPYLANGVKKYTTSSPETSRYWAPSVPANAERQKANHSESQ